MKFEGVAVFRQSPFKVTNYKGDVKGFVHGCWLMVGGGWWSVGQASPPAVVGVVPDLDLDDDISEKWGMFLGVELS
jgi:hypothetical protein